MIYLTFLARNGSTVVNSLRLAAEETDAFIKERMGPSAVTLPQLELLDHLVRFQQPVLLGDLAELLDCARSNVTQLVDRLQQRGLIARLPDPSDRRAVRAALTREGRRRHTLGVEAILRVEQDLRRGFSDEAIRQLLMGLAELRDVASHYSVPNAS
ncbi:MAG: MarR family transcriptional regulator [Gemmatimonadales bacterium]